MSAEDNDKLILKNEDYQGVILSNSDFSLLSSLPPSWTEVTKDMWKEKGKTYIGVKEFANRPGEVIRIGKLRKKYRILQFIRREGTMMGKGGDILRIKRVDGNLTTNVDLDNAKKGEKIWIPGRKSFIQALDHPLGRDYVEPCKKDVGTVLPCDDNDENCNC